VKIESDIFFAKYTPLFTGWYKTHWFTSGLAVCYPLQMFHYFLYNC